MSSVRQIPQETINAMRAEYKALPITPTGRKPWGCIKKLAAKYGISEGYTENILCNGVRDMRET